MSVHVLDWDSQFFGMRVAHVRVDRTMDQAYLSRCLEQCDADVIYVFLPSHLESEYVFAIKKAFGICYDHKVTYAKMVNLNEAKGDSFVMQVTEESDELLRLAYASGHLSRFYCDPLFRPYFKSLYCEWIRKALRDTDSKVFAIMDSGRMNGMATVSVSEGVGRIGLLAVDEKCRGQGLGLRLLKQCDAYFRSLRVHTCIVVTQKNNVAACRLYEKNDYKEVEEVEVWHVWKQAFRNRQGN